MDFFTTLSGQAVLMGGMAIIVAVAIEFVARR